MHNLFLALYVAFLLSSESLLVLLVVLYRRDRWPVFLLCASIVAASMLFFSGEAVETYCMAASLPFSGGIAAGKFFLSVLCGGLMLILLPALGQLAGNRKKPVQELNLPIRLFPPAAAAQMLVFILTGMGFPVLRVYTALEMIGLLFMAYSFRNRHPVGAARGKKGLFIRKTLRSALPALAVLPPLLYPGIPFGSGRMLPEMFVHTVVTITAFVLLLKAAYRPSPVNTVPELFLLQYRISAREREILGILLSGGSYREIGEQLCISEMTVRNHVHSIYQKTHVNSRFDLIQLLSSCTPGTIGELKPRPGTG